LPDNLGSICWYTVHDQEIARDDVTQKLKDARLDVSFTPRRTAPTDAFRRAVRDSEVKKVARFDGTFANFLIRYVTKSKDDLVCQVVREVVNANLKHLSYEQIAEVGLDRATGTVAYRELGSGFRYEEPNIAQAIKERYNRYLDHYNGAHMRIIIHDVLRTLNPVAVRPSGGVYFVPEEGEKTLRRLQAFVKSLGGESDMWLMPVLDNEDARVVVRSTLDAEVTSASAQVIEDLRRMLGRKGEISEGDQRRALAELHRLQDLTTRYEAILEDKLLDARSKVDVAILQVKNLLAA